MISTAGLELTNFINTDLTWKKASKGNRSSTRRTRKLVTKNLMVGMELADNNHRRAGETTVSESEKIGQRFSGKIEHVPIKKRKFNFRSPSPPPRTPSHNEVVQRASGPRSGSNSNENRLLLVVNASSEDVISAGVVDVRQSDSVNGKHGYREDFSGIEMLAAAACSDSFDADVHHREEKPEVEEFLQEENHSAMPMEETVASPKTANCSLSDMIDEDRIEDSSFQDTTSDFAQNSSGQKDNNTVEMSAPSRLHWDLNVVMDAWEQPCDSVSASSQTKDLEGTPVLGSGKLHLLEGYGSEKETKDAAHNDMVDRVAPPKAQEKTQASSDLRGLCCGSDREDNQLEASSHLDSICDEYDADPKASSQVVSLFPSIDNISCPNNMASNTLPPNTEEKAEYRVSGIQEDKSVCAESVHVEKYDVASTRVPAPDRVPCQVDRNTSKEDGEDSAIASSLRNDKSAPQETKSVENSRPPEPVFPMVEPASRAEEVGVNNPSSMCEGVATSSESMKEVQPFVTESRKVEIDSSLHVRSDKLVHMPSGVVSDTIDTGRGLSTHDDCGANGPTNSSYKTDVEEPCDDVYESDTSQDDKVNIVCMENSGELQDGYDSQFEDGELRDSNVHCWEEENNCEGAEIEQVDYDSEGDGERYCIIEGEDTDNKRKLETVSSPGSGDVTEKSEQCAVGDALGDSLTSCEARSSKAVDGSKMKKHADCEDVSNGKDLTSRVVGSRVSYSDVLPRSGSENFDDLCPRPERDTDANRFMGRDRFALHMRRRSPGGGHMVDTRQSPPCHGPYGSGRPRPRSVIDNRVRRKYMSSSSNNVYRPGGNIFNTRHSPPWHVPYGSGRPRPRSVIESREYVMASDRTNLEATGVEGFDSRLRRHMTSSSNSIYRPVNRRSLAYRDDIYAGTAPLRDDISPDRSRFRRYPLRDDSRGIRQDYCRPIPNYSTDDHMQHRLGRRERSISPLGGERLHCVQPYKKPQSRSRSRSPNGWFLLRERNEGSRRRSRSPTFRSARINRVRMPYKKRSEVEYEEGFISPPRNRFSPLCNSRFEDRISGLDNLRDRKSSPVRMFRQSHRFDPVRSIRSMMHPRRFTEMGGPGRGCKYEGGEDDDRRKQGNRYEIIDRVRRYNDNDGGVMRRLRNNNNNNNAEDSSVANES